MANLETIAAVARVAKTGTTTLPDPSIGGSLMKMVVAIAVLGACALIIKRRAAGRTLGQSIFRPAASAAKTRTGLRVISRQALGKGAYLAVVEWEGREVLVGITNAGISFYEEQAAVDTSMHAPNLAPSRHPVHTPAQTTRQMAGQMAGQMTGRTSTAFAESNSMDPTPFPSDAMDLLTKRARTSILDPLRELTVRR